MLVSIYTLKPSENDSQFTDKKTMTADTRQVDPGYTVNMPLWVQIRAAIRGKQGAMALVQGKDGSIVRPMYRVTQDNYASVTKRTDAYFARGRFTNATGRTHDAYLGMIGSAEVELEVPEQMADFGNNVDGQNSTMTDFALHTASEVIITARHGVLVDPPNLTGATLQQAQQAMPRFVSYNAEQIIRHVVMDNQLVMVELLEEYTERKGDDYETAEQVRRLELIDGVYVSRIYRDGTLFDKSVAMIDGKALNYIPFQFIGAENNKPSYDRPVLFDLAHENIGHYQLSCDNLENLHYHGQGMTNVYSDMGIDEFTEANPNGMDVGAKGINMLAQGDRVELLQLAATGAIPEEMQRVERRMIMLGAQVTQDASATQTLGAKEIETNAATSQLKRIARNTSAGLKQCVVWACDMMSVSSDDVSVYVNDRFVTDDMTAQDVQAMFAMYQSGAATLDELNEVKRKAGYTQKTNEELADALDEEAVVQGESEEVARLRMELDNLRAQQGGD